jgi:hypothetical protein
MIGLTSIALLQSMVTLAPPIREARPATMWSCDFLDAAGERFWLKGRFAEAPVGTDPNADLPTVIEGKGPAHLVGKQGYNAFASTADARRYQVTSVAKDGSKYNVNFLFARQEEGLAFITRYVPNPSTGRGRLSTVASGTCNATFMALGAGVSGK